MGGVINIITSHPDAPTLELKPQYGNHNSPKFDFFASDQWNKVVGGRSKAASCTPTGFRSSRRSSAVRSTTTPTSSTRTSPASSSSIPSDRVQGFVRAGYFSENRNNGKIGELNDTRWTTVNGGVRARLARRQRSAGAPLRRRPARALQLPRGDQRRDARATSSAWRPTRTCRPTASAAWRSGRRRSARSNAFSAGFDWRWVDGESQEAAYVASVPTVIVPSPEVPDRRARRRRRCRCSAYSGGIAAEPRRVRAGHLHADRQAGAHAERARRSAGTTTTATTSRRRSRPGCRRRTTGPSIPDTQRHRRQPAHRARCITRSDRVSFWGAVNSGFRAPTLTELYRQFSVGAITTRPNDQLAARAAGRRGSRASTSRRRRTSRSASPGSTTSSPTRCSNVTLIADAGAEAEHPARRSVQRRADRRRVPPRHGVALLRRATSTTTRR